MSNIFYAELNGYEYTFLRFRGDDILESFADYAVHELLPLYMGPDRALTQVHCLLSGFPVFQLCAEEMEAMIRSAVVALSLDRLDSQLSLNENDTVGALEMIRDHIAARLIDVAVPGPSLSYSKNRLALAYLSPARQLSVLLSTLLYDSGMFRDKHLGLDDRHMRIQATITMATRIIEAGRIKVIDDLHAALIELDAKYAIRNLVFIRREAEALAAFRQSDSPAFEDLLTFVIKLIAYRDQTIEVVEDGQQLWSRKVYSDRHFDGLNHAEFSNVFAEVKVVASATTQAKKPGRPKKVLTPEEQAAADAAAKKKAQVASVAATFDDIFADLFNTSKKG